MSNQTGMRKGLRRAAVVAAAAGVAFALPGAPAATATTPSTSADALSAVEKDWGTPDDAVSLSPETRVAWQRFIDGGGQVTGGVGRMISGAWVGSPAIIVSATGGELTADQREAWENWDGGAHYAGRGVAKLVSSVYVGAPRAVLDQIENGAAPGDLSRSELDQVSFLMPLEDVLPSELPGLF